VLALLLLAAAPPDAGASTRLELAAWAGAAYDTNPAQVSGVPDDVGSAALLATAAAGLARDVGDRWSFYGGLRLDGSLQVEFSDLSRALAELEGVALWSPWRAVAFVASASAGGAFYGDPARSGPVLGARTVLRWSPADRLTLRARYARSWREADDPLYSSDAERIGLGAEVRLASASFLRAGFTWERSDEVFYVPSGGTTARPTAALRTGRFGPPGGFSQPVEPVRALARGQIASAGIEIGIGGGAYIDAEFSRSWVEAEPASYVADSVAAVLGVRR